MKTISLTKGKVAIIDDIDYQRVKSVKWYARQNRTGNWYAARKIGINGMRKDLHMHHFILGITNSETILIDHINGNGLDNQRHNLRLVTHSQNTIHSRKRRGNYTSRYKGVCWDKESKKWNAQIYCKGIAYRLGKFKNEKDAAVAYNQKARELFGHYANYN